MSSVSPLRAMSSPCPLRSGIEKRPGLRCPPSGGQVVLCKSSQGHVLSGVELKKGQGFDVLQVEDRLFSVSPLRGGIQKRPGLQCPPTRSSNISSNQRKPKGDSRYFSRRACSPGIPIPIKQTKGTRSI